VPERNEAAPDQGRPATSYETSSESTHPADQLATLTALVADAAAEVAERAAERQRRRDADPEHLHRQRLRRNAIDRGQHWALYAWQPDDDGEAS
jgi:hypothetical protein